MANKIVSKSVRMTKEVYGFIMAMPGNGFNEKLENTILLVKDRKPELEKTQTVLKKKRLEVYHLMEQHRNLEEFYRMYLNMYRQLEEMRQTLEAAVLSGKENGDE